MRKKITQKTRFLISQKTNGRCFYCNKPAEVVDHFLSVKQHERWVLEGYVDPNSIDNLFLACQDCNARKKDSLPEEFIGRSFVAYSRQIRANKRIGIGGGKIELLDLDNFR